MLKLVSSEYNVCVDPVDKRFVDRHLKHEQSDHTHSRLLRNNLVRRTI